MKGRWPVALMCEVLEVSASGYFSWVDGTRGGPWGPRRRLSDEAVLAHIPDLHAELRAEYGWLRMLKELVARGVCVSKERVRKLMQQHSIKASARNKFVVTTDSRHQLPVEPDLVQRRFTPEAPNRVWAGDIGHTHAAVGWLYLAVVPELHSRQIVGWSLKPHMQASVVDDALLKACFRRRPAPGRIAPQRQGKPVLQCSLSA